MIERRAVLLLPLIVAACADDEAPVRSYALPSYSYLSPIRLNVANVEVDDRSPPVTGGSIEALAPIRPVDCLKQMANDRLVASGSNGRAVFVIDRASLTRSGAVIDGQMAVHLDVYAAADGERAGYAEARVARRRTGGNSDSDLRSVLNEFTTQMMADMNVEFEFQVKKSLRDWLQLTAGTAPAPAPIQTQDLGAPGRP